VVVSLKVPDRTGKAGEIVLGFDDADGYVRNFNGKSDAFLRMSHNLKMKGFSDGQMFCSLNTGKGHMPLERVRVNDSELWNLVNYVRSLSK
jgi:hypothetical protein